MTIRQTDVTRTMAHGTARASQMESFSPMREATELSRTYLEGYLSDLWKDRGVTVTSLFKFPRGMSRETWFIECSSHGGHPEKLVLRRDLPTLSIVPTSLEFECLIYQKLQDSDVPIARTLVYEASPERLPDDRPFFIREHVDGDWEMPHFFDPDRAFDSVRISAAKEHIRKLAIIHSLDWKERGFDALLPVPSGPRDCAATAIRRNLEMLDAYKFQPLPIMTEACEWLLDNAPIAERISLLKGTNGLGEEVFRDGRIVAMSDWEQASIGDPASDLARVQDFFNEITRDGRTIWGLDQALDYYAEVSGIRVPRTSVEYYRVFNSFENIVSLQHSASAMVSGSDRLVRHTWLATEVMYYAQAVLLGAISQRSVDARLLYGTQSTKQ